MPTTEKIDGYDIEVPDQAHSLVEHWVSNEAFEQKQRAAGKPRSGDFETEGLSDTMETDDMHDVLKRANPDMYKRSFPRTPIDESQRLLAIAHLLKKLIETEAKKQDLEPHRVEFLVTHFAGIGSAEHKVIQAGGELNFAERDAQRKKDWTPNSGRG